MKKYNCLHSIVYLMIIYSLKAKAQWVQVADFGGTERDDLVAFTCQNRAFAGSGMAVGFQVTNDFYEYEPISNQWIAIANLPSAARQYAFSFSFTISACVFAGITQTGNDLKDGYSYHPQLNQWTSLAPYPGSGSRACAAATLNNYGYVGLGRNNANQLFNDWWQYDLINNSWTQKASFPGLARNLASCFESNGLIYVIGGISDNDIPLDDVWQYNPQTNSWLALATTVNLPTGSAAHCKVKYSGAIVGGYDGGSNYTDNALCFDGFNNSFNSLPPIPNQGNRKGSKAFSLNNVLFITCGITADNTRLKSTWKYDLINSLAPYDLSFDRFNLYPNPVQSDLLITIQHTTPAQAGKYYIIKQDGSEIESGIIPAHLSTLKLNIEAIANGYYLIKLVQAAHVEIKKLIIQHP